MKVSVSILRNKDNIKDTIKALNNTTADYIHLDILDGTYTPEPSFELKEFSKIKTNIPYDIHIMSTNLDFQVEEAIKLKPIVITIQYEACRKLDKYIDLIKENNIKVGIAINPGTSINKVKKYFDKIDYLLIMSVQAGYGGQEFIPSTIKKLDKLNKMNPNFLVGVDGGINYENTKLLLGKADILVVGSYITASNYYEDQILKLKHLKNN
ncbi:MAG: ribulose-phosphate 3-epimerase [Bacilli bacterium]|nr:ribulose-phosphate 3-epimerase [Bacilli bacterium]